MKVHDKKRPNGRFFYYIEVRSLEFTSDAYYSMGRRILYRLRQINPGQRFKIGQTGELLANINERFQVKT